MEFSTATELERALKVRGVGVELSQVTIIKWTVHTVTVYTVDVHKTCGPTQTIESEIAYRRLTIYLTVHLAQNTVTVMRRIIVVHLIFRNKSFNCVNN